MSEHPSAILLGSKPGGAVAAEVLVQRGWRLAAVVATDREEDRPARGASLMDVAVAAGIPVVTMSELTEPVDVVFSYLCRRRIPRHVLDLGRTAALNFHPAPLPHYGGWAMYNMAILERASSYGPTCHHMDEGLDTGPIVEVSRFPIDPDTETALTLERRTQDEMIRLFVDVCARLERGEALSSHPQVEAERRYMSLDELEARKDVPSDADATTVLRYVRAFFYPPFGGARIAGIPATVTLAPREALAHVAPALHAGDVERLRSVVLAAGRP